MNYKEFAAQFRAEKKGTGVKADITTINKAWKEFQEKEKSAVEEKIEVVPQATEILQQQPVTAQSEEKTVEVKPEENLDREKMYTAVADSVHQALAGIVSLSTNKEVQINEKQIEKLNTSGVLLLKKYDVNGKLLEYSPEIAYCLTLADIGTQVYLELRKKKTVQQKQEVKLPEPATNSKQDVNSFNKLIEKA
ncbi:MAG: hypothetical protein AABW89_05085 [Nanoarchaeota archaeon]